MPVQPGDTLAHYRIVEQTALIPMVAFWSMLNVVVLFLVCMMCLQTPVRRGEERFDLDEEARLELPDGKTAPCQLADMSLSGARLTHALPAPERPAAGARIRIAIKGVGPVDATAVWINDEEAGIHFDLPQGPVRNRVIRKLFTNGLDSTAVSTHAWKATFGLIKRIWTLRAAPAADEAGAESEVEEEKLPKRTLLIPPAGYEDSMEKIAKLRRRAAAKAAREIGADPDLAAS